MDFIVDRAQRPIDRFNPFLLLSLELLRERYPAEVCFVSLNAHRDPVICTFERVNREIVIVTRLVLLGSLYLL